MSVANNPQLTELGLQAGLGRDGPACRYCAGTDFEPLFSGVRDRLGFAPGVWSFRRCRTCGSAQLHPFPRQEDLPSYYPPVYSFAVESSPTSSWRRVLSRFEYAWFYQRQYEGQVNSIQRTTGVSGRGKKLLDVGCGRGMRLLAFQRRGFEVHGLDFQAEAVDHVRTELGIDATLADVDDMATHFPPGTFDLVTAFQVIEHVPDVATFVGDCQQLLRPGGWLVLAVPLIDSWQGRCFGRRWATITEAPRHLSIPSRRGLVGLCTRLGFADVTLQGDSVFMSAGVVGLSLVPGAATTHCYGGPPRPGAFWSRCLAMVAVALALPWCWLENHLLRQPAIGLLIARKPAEIADPNSREATS